MAIARVSAVMKRATLRLFLHEAGGMSRIARPPRKRAEREGESGSRNSWAPGSPQELQGG